MADENQKSLFEEESEPLRSAGGAEGLRARRKLVKEAWESELENATSGNDEGRDPDSLTIADAKTYLLAGRATVTVRNEKTGNRFTYRITRRRDSEGKVVEGSPHFVGVLGGPDNTSDYRYLGTIFDESKYLRTKGSKLPASAQSARVFKWFFTELFAGTLPPFISVFHNGTCGRCGRKLTVPESIKNGIGPVCAGL